MVRTSRGLLLTTVTVLYALLWLVSFADWMWLRTVADRLAGDPFRWYWPVFTLSLPLAGAWLAWALWPVRRDAVTVAVVCSGVYVAGWHWAVFAADALIWDGLRVGLARTGLAGLFLLGLGWVVWWVDRAAQQYEARRRAARGHEDPLAPPVLRASGDPGRRIWNPLDPQAWIYGRRGQKLNQSLAALVSYSLLFCLLVLASLMMGGCQEIYEMPAGGGEEQAITQVVKIQPIIRKKYVVNPFSSVLFEVPPIEEIKLELTEVTQHAYEVGQGEGSGAGFSAGTQRGAVRFIRLQYSGGDWDQGGGIGADVNMLMEYGIRTKQKVANRPETRRVTDLKNFPVGKSPPLVYMTGQKSISLSNSEIKILREFLLDKRGMLMGDNGGSLHFHNQFLSMMNQVLPNVRPVKVPLDDPIHRVPYPIPFLPYVAPHGGRDALGWKVDGRWVCYYHPGDIGDAWSDTHAGVDRRIWEACYQLGTNVIFYAHAEYNKWLSAREGAQ